MRPLLRPLIACAAVFASAAAEDDAVALAVQALSALRRGELAPLEGLPADAALAPVDLPDPAEPGLRRRWSLAMPALVAGLEPAARARALAVLARRAEAACALAGPGGALDALPAPAALATLARAADRAFDHGRFTQAQQLWRVLAAAGASAPAPRQAVAARLAGEADPAEPGLPAPAGLEPLAEPPPVPAVADGARAEGPWLVERDPWGRALWRRPLDGAETVVAGGAWTLLQGPAGLVAVDADGRARSLLAPPPRTRVRAVAAGVAWFVRPAPAWARGRAGGDPADAWRLPLDGGAVAELTLPEEPLGAPLVRGSAALWLGRLHVWRSEAGRLAAQAVHGQMLSTAARLHWERGSVVVVDGAAAWRLGAVPAALRPDPAWGGGEPGDDRRAAAVRLHARAAAGGAPAAVEARRNGDWIAVTARGPAGVAWVRRWVALPLDRAPAQQALLGPAGVNVVEGGHHLTTLAAADGALRGWACIVGAEIDPGLALAWAPRCGAALVPGTCDRLLVTVEGAERSEALPAPATALAVADGALALELADGRRLRVPFTR